MLVINFVAGTSIEIVSQKACAFQWFYVYAHVHTSFVYVFSYNVPNFIQNFIQNSTGQKNIAMFLVYGQNFCSVLYIDSYFLSLIQ